MSSGNHPLAILAQEREHILLAEVAGLLHDIGKFCDVHIEANSSGGSTREWSTDHAYKAVIDNPGTLITLSRTAANLRKPAVINGVLNARYPKAADFLSVSLKSALQQIAVTVQGTDYLLAELIMMGTPGFAVDNNRNQLLDGKDGWLPALLGVCHHESHHDKPEKPEYYKQQVSHNVLVSTAFGYEKRLFVIGHLQDSLDIRLKSLPVPPRDASDVPAFKENIKLEFAHGLGDTRRPVNDVILADWSFSVASLLKTILSASLLDNIQHSIRSGWLSWRNKEMDHDLRWRILRISFDGLAFLERVTTIGDVLGRRKALSDALDRVRHLLEWHYPLGNEIYRDEYGSAFIVPALDGDDKIGNRLHGMIDALILDAFRASELGGELRPSILISEADKKAAVLNKLLKESTLPLHPFPDSIKCWWQGEPADICTVCGVRPQGWGAPSDYYKRKAQERNICHVCLDRRSERAKQWAQGRYPQKSDEERKQWERTIWIDEVADDNGRLALLVGRFDLSEWLGGDMIQTMLVACDPSKNVYESKNPSFARIQRVWRTTQQFWQEVQDADIPSIFNNMQQYRLAIDVENSNELCKKLGDYHVYDADLNGRRLSVVWDSEKRQLVTADNLVVWTGSRNISTALHRHMLKQQSVFLHEPGGYRQQRKLVVRATIRDVEVIQTPYIPAIAILNEPASFMALVPAEVALDIATKVRERYEQEMSKVCNRLPFFLYGTGLF